MIIPEYRLLMWYDIHPEKYERYFRYMLQDFVPTMQKMGLLMIFAWQINYGSYPSRQIEFICEDRQTLRMILASDVWKKAEARLKSYTTQYGRKIIRFQDRFQL